MKASEIVEVEDDEDEKESEDWCFVCKDGGSLMVCDYKDCPKVYHAACIENDTSVRGNGDSLICQWHSCYMCKKRPKLFCLCCPNAVCEGCVTHAEFTRLREKKGLCNQCEEYVFALEEIQEYDAAGDKIDLTDPNTVECLFLEYWGIVKDQEDITFEDVRASSKSRKKSAKSSSKDDPIYSVSDLHSSKLQKKGVKRKNEDDRNFSLSDHPAEDAEDYKIKGKAKRMEFIRWGSKPLIDFLTSIGEDTRDAMSQHSVESVIRRYIREKNLLDPETKKKKVLCDDKLYSIFRKRSVNQKRIYTLLNAHLKENVEQLEYLKRLERGFSEKNEEVLVPCKKQKTERADEDMICAEEELKPEMEPTGLATINEDNIKLVYLRKSLIIEFLKQNESFEDKVVGSFVKVKNSPMDYIAFQILQVTGINTANGQSDGVLLCVAGMESDVSISKLDDSDISKEDIENLKQKVMNGLVRQPTVVEMEQKAKALHEDITKHWIARQLTVLQRRINFANEKGRRKQLDEYLEERERLQKPSEQERLMRKTPEIIEDLIEIKQEPAASSDGSKPENLEERELLGKPADQEGLIRETPKIIEIKQEAGASSDSSKQGNTSVLSQDVINID